MNGAKTVLCVALLAAASAARAQETAVKGRSLFDGGVDEKSAWTGGVMLGSASKGGPVYGMGGGYERKLLDGKAGKLWGDVGVGFYNSLRGQEQTGFVIESSKETEHGDDRVVLRTDTKPPNYSSLEVGGMHYESPSKGRFSAIAGVKLAHVLADDGPTVTTHRDHEFPEFGTHSCDAESRDSAGNVIKTTFDCERWGITTKTLDRATLQQSHSSSQWTPVATAGVNIRLNPDSSAGAAIRVEGTRNLAPVGPARGWTGRVSFVLYPH